MVPEIVTPTKKPSVMVKHNRFLFIEVIFSKHMIRKELLKEFQKLIKEEYDRELNLIEAEEIMNNLVAYFDLLAKIYHREQSLIKTNGNKRL